jgi:hypothetical protein
MMLGSFDFSAAETDAVQQSVAVPQTNASRAERNRKRDVRVLADKASATLADGMVHPLRIFGVVCLPQYQPTAPQGQAHRTVNPL